MDFKITTPNNPRPTNGQQFIRQGQKPTSQRKTAQDNQWKQLKGWWASLGYHSAPSRKGLNKIIESVTVYSGLISAAVETDIIKEITWQGHLSDPTDLSLSKVLRDQCLRHQPMTAPQGAQSFTAVAPQPVSIRPCWRLAAQAPRGASLEWLYTLSQTQRLPTQPRPNWVSHQPTCLCELAVREAGMQDGAACGSSSIKITQHTFRHRFAFTKNWWKLGCMDSFTFARPFCERRAHKRDRVSLSSTFA